MRRIVGIVGVGLALLLSSEAWADPIAGYTMPLNPTRSGMPVHFDASSSTAGSASDPIVKYEWDFNGDGVWDLTSTSATATVTYAADDGLVRYVPLLRVTSLSGQVDYAANGLFLDGAWPTGRANSGPVADAGAVYNPLWGVDVVYRTMGQDLFLDGRASFDPDAVYGDGIVSYAWEIQGKGLFYGATLTLSAADYSWLLQPYDYWLRLTVTDAWGATSTQWSILSAAPSPVPEPTTLALFGLGAAGLAWRRRRTRGTA